MKNKKSEMGHLKIDFIIGLKVGGCRCLFARLELVLQNKK